MVVVGTPAAAAALNPHICRFFSRPIPACCFVFVASPLFYQQLPALTASQTLLLHKLCDAAEKKDVDSVRSLLLSIQGSVYLCLIVFAYVCAGLCGDGRRCLPVGFSLSLSVYQCVCLWGVNFV